MDEQALRQKAAECLQLAKTCNDEGVAKWMRGMAAEYVQQADEQKRPGEVAASQQQPAPQQQQIQSDKKDE